MVKDFCQKMNLPKIKKGKKENLDIYINISNQVLKLIKKDREFLNEYREFTNKDSNYNDRHLHLLTQDFIYTIANQFDNLEEENTMKNYTIFKLYNDYLNENRKGEITNFTINAYVKEAANVVPFRWEKEYNSDFKSFEIIYENLQLLKPLLEKGFSGYTSFKSFIHKILEKYKSKQPLNQILYGPPGTGKTYKTKKIAVEIIENTQYTDSKVDREIILEKYENYVNTENIIFTTFHQSMSYEDFIEGIKPLMDEGEEKEISYTIQDGIFKTLCQKASESVNNQNFADSKGEILFFEKAWTHLIEDYTETSSNSKIFTLPTSTNMGMNVVEITNKGNLLLKPSKGSSLDYTVSYNRMQKLFNAIPDLSTISNIDKEFRKVIGGANSTAYWCVLNYLRNWVKDNEESLKVRTVEGVKRKENHVIIIDEINRGNVSAIFGELITLIEKDKRAEEKEAINITLAYSKTKFSVPNNVFIIGTMNTADRSVEALDTALRRRFSFEEISPNPKLLEEHKYQEVNLNLLLDKINQRIELLVDKDHQIGHSYFFSINSLDDLKIVFKDKIIPLLEEYFYGDLGKIGLVLGESFIEPVKEQNRSILATFKAYDDIDFVSDKKIFRIKSIDEMTEQDFTSIYQ